jgi:NAD(P)-dependent dehydrogenase (short-subunit alcohol dehydrogenase family)
MSRDLFDLSGRVAIVTGSGRGLGKAIAGGLAQAGASVVVCARHTDEADEVAAAIVADGGAAISTHVDTRDRESCRRLVATTVEQLGRVDILVNNAAFQMTHDKLEEISDEEWDRTFDTNIGAMFRLCKAALPHLKPGSAIVNTASVNVDKAPPKLIAYSATKAAIANFTASLGQLLAEQGIRVNCVAPGPIWTPLIPSTMPAAQVESFGQQVPMKRPGQPAEVAPAFVYLASQDASYVTGALVPVTGGTPM